MKGHEDPDVCGVWRSSSPRRSEEMLRVWAHSVQAAYPLPSEQMDLHHLPTEAHAQGIPDQTGEASP